MVRREPPRFTGVDTYQDHLGRFSFRFPTHWQRSELDEQRDGVMYRPVGADEQTSLVAWVTQLDHPATAEDLDVLRDGIDQGIASLAAASVEEASDVVLENLLKFERVCTFLDSGATRKRKTWILYVDKWLIVLTWQGASQEEYDYWLAMANYSYATFTLPPALWFAVDRDLNRKE